MYILCIWALKDVDLTTIPVLVTELSGLLSLEYVLPNFYYLIYYDVYEQ